MRTGSAPLIGLGLLCVAFFLATDPRYGWGLRLDGDPQTNRIDAYHDARPGTIVGVAGGAIAVLGGMWLAIRRVA